MNRQNLNHYSQKWQQYQNLPTTGSLIVSSPVSPKNNGHHSKYKLEEYGFKHHQLTRHQSEKQLKKIQHNRPTTYFYGNNFKVEEQITRNNHVITKIGQNNTKRISNSKGTEKQLFFRGRNSGGKITNNLTETMSTQSTQGLTTYKSQKTFPSFLRNQVKSPQKYKTKEGLSKQHFKIIRRLGEGKFGSVYLAKQIFTGIIVGLKVVEKARIKRDNFLVQFIRELKIQSSLDHPNIIKIYGYFHDQQHFYIVMQLGCDGQLFDIISNGQTLSEEVTSFVIGNLLEAINLIHSKKILHRDIKPQNIVLVHGNIKLCDFGWAVHKKQELRSTFCGTPLYLSPQILQGSRYDEKVDLWSIGILTYQLFYGTSPFNINQEKDLEKIITDQVNIPANKKISPQFRQFLYAILKKNPQERKECKALMSMQFIKKYRELQTCQQLCH